MPHTHQQKIQVVHATAPTCFWSWGYEAVFNRLRLVYGDQIGINILTSYVYDDFDEWFKENEIDWEGFLRWIAEASELMGTPLLRNPKREQFPKTVVPATLAVMAANLQGQTKGERFCRSLVRRMVVEGEDVTRDDILITAAIEAGLDEKRFLRDYAQKETRQAELEHQGEGFPPVHVGFYNLAVTDGDGRTVLLDYCFDPKRVEGAIDYLSNGTLKKQTPTDILAYLREHGFTPQTEIERVFDLTPEEAEKRLHSLQSSGKVESRSLADQPHWKLAE